MDIRLTYNLPAILEDVEVKLFLTLGKTIEFPLLLFIIFLT